MRNKIKRIIDLKSKRKLVCLTAYSKPIAKILDNYTQLNSKTIWTTSLGLATLTGYFRIAADKHYFTDIIAGAMVGTLVGYLGFDALHDKYVGTKNSKPKYFPKFSCSPNNINLTLKL